MRPIVFFSDELSPTLEKVAEALSQNNKEIIIVTHQDLKKNKSILKTQFEIWYYYKKYSYWEHFRLLPSLLFKKPEVTHFFFHDVNHVKYFLPLIKWFHQWPDCITSVTFLNNNDWDKNSDLFQKVSRCADVITFPDHDSMKSIKGFTTPKKQLRSLLPPFLNFQRELNSSPNEKKDISARQFFFAYSEELFASHSDLWMDLKLALSLSSVQTLIWMDSDKYSLWDKKRLQQHMIQRRFNVHILYLPLISLNSFVKKEDLFFIHHNHWPALQTSQLIELNLQQQSFLVLQDRQATQYSSCLKHTENCFILNGAEKLKTKWSDILKLSPSNYKSEPRFRTDPYINELTRIYNKALKSKELYYV